VNDPDCTSFLQWALPRLDLRWAGFRKVRRQVCKRLKRRMSDLGIEDFGAYRARIEADPADGRWWMNAVTSPSRVFFRDRGVFEVVRRHVLPDIAVRASEKDEVPVFGRPAVPPARSPTR